MQNPPFDTVLVANRGEIAVRVIRTLKSLGIRAVAVYSDPDASALHVREADEAIRLGPGPATQSYLNIEAVLDACTTSGAQAVHPGYGFLSENERFAAALEAAGISFIGPSVYSMHLMGDKISAKNHVAAHSVPTTEGVAEPGLDDAALISAAERIGAPLLIKPSAGGGGKGMVAVHDLADLPEALASARRTARSAFGDETLLLERLVTRPRHIEVQVLADQHGNIVHLGERECSLQRRHQKVIEEAPAPLLEGLPNGAAIRERLGAAAVAAARSVEYTGAGTVEFLVSDDRPEDFYFMEMNTRLQVEHPVTEAAIEVAGAPIDLVAWQVRIAAGERLDFTQDQVAFVGHAVEARVYAEDPQAGFLPSAGRILALNEPTGPGIRVDSSLCEGGIVGTDYDPMLAKVIATADTRAQALARLDRALGEMLILGVRSNLHYLRALLANDEVQAGRLDTGLIERTLESLQPGAPESAEVVLVAAWVHARRNIGDGLFQAADGWRLGAQALPATVHLALDEQSYRVQLGPDGRAVLHPEDAEPSEHHVDGPAQRLTVDGRTRPVHIVREGSQLWVRAGSHTRNWRVLTRSDRLAKRLAGLNREGTSNGQLTAPMPGTVVAVGAVEGQQVSPGDLVATIEAMKMEHQLTAPIAGVLRRSPLSVGDLVTAGQLIATVEPVEEQS
ncbi:biotin carboxylase N-terminal domain-containing protein [Glutamicibacter sp. PS]|uniref:acetyl/propionyl/methylcrotonyl-CoA carboxylase subunit alpha n=1 Tax=Glutamicibacter sp. PS TaxID=3075634 RepID=UPI002851D4B7|nr:biotin carboxylase N-terminal domain-containing protein [Glutamicibacter sp. PS]MDR4534549.1 acetyl/propionyl-CoA carboxylase subunit alpha [Glutamicibacter sp. PS]